VIDPDDVFDNTSATVLLIGFAAVDSSAELLDVDVRSVDPGRMNRLKFPMAYTRLGMLLMVQGVVLLL
jgi:hypothetical protein